MTENKQERFKRVASKRIQRVLRELKLFGNCGDRHNYDYTNEEVEKLFNAIDQALDAARSRYSVEAIEQAIEL